MEDLFRFVQIREPHRDVSEIDPIDLSTTTAFQQSIANVGAAPDRREQIKALAAGFTTSPNYLAVGDPHEVVSRLEDVNEVMDIFRDEETVTHADVESKLTAVLGESPGAFVADAGVAAQVENLKDTIVTIKLVPAEHKRPIRRYASALRAYEFLLQFVSDPTFLSDGEEIAKAQRRGLRLPEAVLSARPPARPPEQKPSLEERLKPLAERYELLDDAITELRSVRPQDFVVTKQTELEERMPPDAFRPLALFKHEWEIRQQALRSTMLAGGTTIAEGVESEGKLAGSLPAMLAAVADTQPETASPGKPGITIGAGARIAVSGRPAFIPVELGLAGMRLSPEAAERLTGQTKEVLGELNIELNDPVAGSVETLLSERRKVHEAAQELIQPITKKTFQYVGSTLVSITDTPAPELLSFDPVIMIGYIPGIVDIAPGSVPASSADIEPAGAMDLLLVRQQLKGYEAAEVSHIENIMIGEFKDRIHRKRLETETILFRETEVTTTTENSLETTDRFEMRRESQEALQEQTDVKGSLTISGRYGPSVKFQASGEASWSRRSEQSSSAASEVAREVTQKASEKVTERILQRETRRTLREIEETNQHTLDNKEGEEHVIGIYQWVSKVYEAQVFNYGERTIYDLMIPEPGAFLLEAFQRRRTAALELVKPPAFRLKPDQLTEDIYQTYVVLYGATDVKPPPEPYVTEAYDFNTGGEDKDQEFTNSTRIKIPKGYRAIRATMGSVVAVWDNWAVDVIIGQRAHRFSSGSSSSWVWTTYLDHETGAVPLAMTTDQVGDVSIAVEVICESPQRACDLWRADTHAKLLDAYRARLSEYEAKLAELQAEAPAEIESGPSAHNLLVMTDEVKKACISVLTEQHFDHFDAINTGAFGLPTIDFTETEAEGAYVRFFEQAFEWENISWITYPYFWGRKSTWLDRVIIQNDDQNFEDFLKAGYVRVVIPVRRGFEAAVDHFRLLGEPWFGGSLPTVSDETYLPIADEIAERLDRPGDEIPQGDPWEVRVPTSLVKLRSDGKLPSWTKQPDGTWLPDPEE
jgi:hypothetical protein